MGITSILSLVTTRLILNSLGQADFGIYNVVGGAIAMLGFINAAMASTTQRFLNYSEGEGDPEKQRSVFNVSIILHSGIAALMVLILALASFAFFGGVLDIPTERVGAAKVVYLCLVFSTAVTILTAPFDAVITSHENMKYYAFVGIIESLLKLSVAVACVHTTFDKLILYGILMAFIPLISLSIMLSYCSTHYSECVFAPRKYFSSRSLKEMGGFAGWSFAMTSTSMVTQYGFGIVLNSFFGVLLNAAYGVANQLSGMLSSVSTLAQKAYNPILIKSEGSGDRKKLTYVSLFGCRVSFLIFGTFAIPAILLMPELLNLWLKKVPEWAVIFARLQLLRILLEQLYSGLNSAILASGKIKQYAVFTSLAFILPILILPVLFSLGFKPYWLFILWIIFWPGVCGTLAAVFANVNVGIRISQYIKNVIAPSAIVILVSILPPVVSQAAGVSKTVFYLMVLLQVMMFVVLGWIFLLQKRERYKILSFIHRV